MWKTESLNQKESNPQDLLICDGDTNLDHTICGTILVSTTIIDILISALLGNIDTPKNEYADTMSNSKQGKLSP